MNMRNLMSQLMASSNPIAMIMGMMNPNQKKKAEALLKKPKEEQYEEIAKYCNENGITKEQLQSLINMFNK